MVEWLREFSQEHMLATLIITILFWGTVFWFLFKFSIKVIVFIIRFLCRSNIIITGYEKGIGIFYVITSDRKTTGRELSG
jgi:hypothetical protein